MIIVPIIFALDDTSASAYAKICNCVFHIKIVHKSNKSIHFHAFTLLSYVSCY